MIKTTVSQVLLQARSTSLGACLVLASGLAGTTAGAAPGDLDPGFGDAGRLTDGIDSFGAAWAIDVEDDGDAFLAGGGEYCYYECSAISFVRSLSSSGLIDTGYEAASLSDTLVYDIALQPDSKLLGTGRSATSDGPPATVIFRLLADGSADLSFGEAGLVHVRTDTFNTGLATSILLETDGRIVVAGSHRDRLFVARLLPDGDLDASFGSGGIHTGPSSDTNQLGTELVRLPNGGYRVSNNYLEQSVDGPESRCQVLALTASGVPDVSFGTAGSAKVEPAAGAPTSCNGLTLLGDGLVVGGQVDAVGFLLRLLPDGTRDPAFTGSDVVDQMSRVTELTMGPAESLLVAGSARDGDAAALVTRLHADGTTDAGFGDAGLSRVYLPAAWIEGAVVHGMAALDDGSLTLVGGRAGPWGGDEYAPFVARLRGDDSADAAGIVSLTHAEVLVAEDAGQATVTVRRSGGSAGAVRATYRTVRNTLSSHSLATPVDDYTDVSGQLDWADGDTTDRLVTIPIVARNDAPEVPESFVLQIEAAEDGPALGGRGTVVTIAADGEPGGQISIDQNLGGVEEGNEFGVWVHRSYYHSGAVSARISLSGSATSGEDYDLDSMVVSWEDGDLSSKQLVINVRRDGVSESMEDLVLTLSEPAGGAILGSQSTTRLVINDRAAEPPASSSGGGGRVGWLSLLLLGAASMRRRL